MSEAKTDGYWQIERDVGDAGRGEHWVVAELHPTMNEAHERARARAQMGQRTRVIHKQHDPETDADPETGELPWDGFRDGRIQNFLGLDWAGRKLAEYQRGIAQNEAACEAEVARLYQRTAELNVPLRKQAECFRTAIESYAKEHKSEILIGRAKSRETPSGLVLKWRTQKAGYRWDQSKTPAENKAALLAWTKEQDTTMRLSAPGPEQPAIDEIKKYLAIFDGEGQPPTAPPGLEYIPAGETLTVSVGEEESK